jgi:hypothetical protein
LILEKYNIIKEIEHINLEKDQKILSNAALNQEKEKILIKREEYIQHIYNMMMSKDAYNRERDELIVKKENSIEEKENLIKMKDLYIKEKYDRFVWECQLKTDINEELTTVKIESAGKFFFCSAFILPNVEEKIANKYIKAALKSLVTSWDLIQVKLGDSLKKVEKKKEKIEKKIIENASQKNEGQIISNKLKATSVAVNLPTWTQIKQIK